MFKGPNLTFTIAGLLFIAIGIVLRLFFQGTEGFLDSLPDTSLNVGVSILAVSIIEAMWRQLGSDPLQKTLDEIRKAFQLFGDSQETGVFHLHKDRSSYVTKGRMTELLERAKMAHHIDLMGRVLSRDVTNNEDLLKVIKARVISGECHLRVLIPDPTGLAAQQRDEQEAKLNLRAKGAVIADANGSIQRFMNLKSELPIKAQKRVELKLIQEIQIFANIFRVDDYIWIQPYLYHSRGGQSPQIEVEGAENAWFQRYHHEFEAIWNDASDLPTTT